MPEHTVDPGVLRKISIFSALSDNELNAILASPQNGIEEYGPKKIIVREAETAQSMYVIIDGVAEVTIRSGDAAGREVPIATLRAGDFFGEQALIESSRTGRRGATVRALSGATVFRIDKEHVRLALQKDEVDESEVTTVANLSPEEKEVRDLLQGMRLFQSLTEKELSTIGTWTKVEEVGPGDFVLKESQKGDCMYVVLDGDVEIFTMDEDGKIVLLATLGKGDYFGEQALLPGSTGERNAYARSNGLARLIQIPKAYFRLVLNRDSAVAESLKKIAADQKKAREQAQKHR